MAGRHARLDRLTPLDMSNLRVEEHGLPMHVAALVVLDPAGSGRPDLDRLRDVVERRLHLVPRSATCPGRRVSCASVAPACWRSSSSASSRAT